MVPKSAAPPASTGAAGPKFEAQVAAYYLLAMLRGAEPRGMPGVIFDRVELQRAAEGFPLDDVIVHGHDQTGTKVVLEVQVKRGISFAPKDRIFKEVVRQIAKVMQKPEFWTSSHKLAVATAKTTHAITGSYQEVLNWAIALDSSAVFIERIARRGSANDEMRAFVDTLRSHLREEGVEHDDETVWQVLRRLQIHVYDFNAVGSISDDYARERAAGVLHPEAKAQAGSLWESIITYALDLAGNGGSTTRQGLIARFKGTFRFEGERRHYHVRKAIAEASQQALDDISSTVGGVVLGRVARVAEIRTAAEAGRFVEIRGNAGVGKSGLLKHLAEETARASRVLVLSPGRVPQSGWLALRSQIGFDGTAKELLWDLACDGSTWVFIDNLDFFAPAERTTIIDLVRAAADTPGVTVIATARHRYGIDDPSWLPEDSIGVLGRAKPVLVNELSDDEIRELRAAKPQLRALLADGHPAKAVTRNLFRLSRLVQLPKDEQELRSEVDMAVIWWSTADGEIDSVGSHRERARLIRDIAVRSVKGEIIFDVSTHSSPAIDALVSTETLRDFGNDHVGFRHDVLREWALANVLFATPDVISELPFRLPASPALTRGIELTAQIILEKEGDPDRWCTFLDTVSRADYHPSWRRAALLGITHSEVSEEIVSVMSETLLMNDAALLRELIPIMVAVDVLSMRDIYAKAGFDASAFSGDLSIPSSPGWMPLVEWIIDLGEELPAAAIPVSVELLKIWCHTSLITRTTLTTKILDRFKCWLIEIEKSDDSQSWIEGRGVFRGELPHKEINRMQETLRFYISLFAVHEPEIAKEYLCSLMTRDRKAEIYSKIFKFRGSFAEAAPAELAAITLDALIDSKEAGEGRYAKALTYLDHQFNPVSPAQGPFFDLLTHAPVIGLRLIRTLIDKVIEFDSSGRVVEEDDTISIELPDGTRHFPWVGTYGWSRSCHYSAITSGLMALEVWAHARAENGESINLIIDDIIGPADAPAAYLLVVVDVLLSHWPMSSAAAVPYVACPELLSLDLGRPLQEFIEIPDIFGLGALEKEPYGPSLKELKSRVSRRVSLAQLLLNYACSDDYNDLRKEVENLLNKAVDRLGPFEHGDDLAAPRLMAFHALNRLDAANYIEVEHEQSSDKTGHYWEYAPPESEAKHFELLQKDEVGRQSNAQAFQAVTAVVNNPERSTPELAEELAIWAQRAEISDSEDTDESYLLANSVVGAAMVAMRDGTPELRKRVYQWTDKVFEEALLGDEDIAARLRSGLLYNPRAMAFAGRVFAMRDRKPTRQDLRLVLEMATGEPSVAHGAAGSIDVLRSLNAKLSVAVLRVAFATSLQVRHRWDADESEKSAAAHALRSAVIDQVDAELAWLCDGSPEPKWPSFSADSVRSKRRSGIRIGSTESEARPSNRDFESVFIDHQSTALWLRSLWQPADSDQDWSRDMCSSYATWTLRANGAGMAEDEESAERPMEWNSIFFKILAECMSRWSQIDIEAAIEPILALRDREFFDICAEFLRQLDIVFFNEGGLDPTVAVAVRGQFAARLANSYSWQRLRATKSDGIELHMGSAGAVLFFSDHNFAQTPTCYLFEPAIDKSLEFIPVLQDLAVNAPSPFVAILCLNWFEVSPRMAQMPMLLAFWAAALDAYSDDRSFWVDHDIGPRVCAWIIELRKLHPENFIAGADNRPEIDRLLARLVAIGVVEARRLEILLNEEI